MRWISLIVAGMLSCLILSTKANAGPIQLILDGGVPGGSHLFFNNYRMDVTNGFEGLSVTESAWPPLTVTAPGHFEQSFSLDGIVLISNSAPYEYIDFEITGKLSGEFYRYEDGTFSGRYSGTGSVSDLSIFPASADPADVPSWLPGLTATVSAVDVHRLPIADGDVMRVSVTLSSHPVPEPTSFVVLGAGLFALAVRRCHRRGFRAAI